MNKLTSFVLSASVMLLTIGVQQANANSINVTDSSRSVEVGQNNIAADQDSTSTTGVFNSSAAQDYNNLTVYAEQNSSNSGPIFSGTGLAQVPFSLQNQDNAYAKTEFHTQFELQGDYDFTLTFNLNVNANGGVGSADFSFWNGSTPLASGYANQSSGSDSGNPSGTLSTGIYDLYATAFFGPNFRSASDAWYGGKSTFDFTLTLTEKTPDSVPEPATMLLFGTGLVGLAGSSVRRRKHA